MKLFFTPLVLLVTFVANAQQTKQQALNSIDLKYDKYAGAAKKIWEFAEVGFQETQSSALLQKTLADEGF